MPGIGLNRETFKLLSRAVGALERLADAAHRLADQREAEGDPMETIRLPEVVDR